MYIFNKQKYQDRMFNSGGWKITVHETATSIEVELYLKIALCDSTNDKSTNLSRLANEIQSQMKRTFEITYLKKTYNYTTNFSGLDNFPSKTIHLPVFKSVQVKFRMKHRLITNSNQRGGDEQLVLIVPNAGDAVRYYGRVNKIGGNSLELNVNYIPNILKGLDNNTIPHELGHSLSLLHVNSLKTYAKDPRQYFPHKKQTTRDSTNVMFEGGSRYMNDVTSTSIIPKQIEIIIENYRLGNINLR